MRKLLLFAVAMCNILLMAQTNQITWVNGRAVLGLSISSIDSLKYGTVEKAQKLELWLPETIVVHDTVMIPYAVHDTVIVHDTIIINKCDSSHAPAGVEMVDLGLPSGIKWANMNVGATSPEEYGDYFSWGETEPKKEYSLSTCKYYRESTYIDNDGVETTIEGYTKYVRSGDASSYGFNGFYDNKTSLDSEDDAAHVNWGGDWRMPTKAEQDELRDNCEWQGVSLNGINGYKVIGKNGNWIFLPASGYCEDSSLYKVGCGYYWSSELTDSYSNNAYYLYFDSGVVDWLGNFRYPGQPVRPVCR